MMVYNRYNLLFSWTLSTI